MFPNLNAEMARKKITVRKLSELTDIPEATLYTKLRGERPFKLHEAKEIKQAIGTSLPLDTLFETEVA